MNQIIKALALYYNNHGYYPAMNYNGACGSAINGLDALSLALSGDNVISKTPSVPSNIGTPLAGGICGNYYYTGSWNGPWPAPTDYSGLFNNQQRISVFVTLENADSNCSTWLADNSGWYNGGGGSYCAAQNGKPMYIQILQ